MSKRITLRRIAIAATLLVTVVGIVFWATVRATRPNAPDLTDSNEWTLIKSAAVAQPPVDVRVFFLRHRSSTWDPYDVNQNKIVVTAMNGERKFIWPKNNTFAAGWCELFEPNDQSIAIVLFENENAVRIVQFSNGQFSFRSAKDELISPLPLKYDDLDRDGQPEFVGSSGSVGSGAVGRVWRWSEADGFDDVTAQYRNVRGLTNRNGPAAQSQR